MSLRYKLFENFLFVLTIFPCLQILFFIKAVKFYNYYLMDELLESFHAIITGNAALLKSRVTSFKNTDKYILQGKLDFNLRSDSAAFSFFNFIPNPYL